jgi:predicted CXXCH cytochrome family protein
MEIKMKYRGRIGLIIIFSFVFLCLEFGSSSVWSFVNQGQTLLAKKSNTVINASMSNEINHSMYTSKEKCIKCHPRLFPSHMFSKPSSMSDNLHLDTEGKIICTTCHNCSTINCLLIKNNRDLCKICHDCIKGMSCIIGVAHLGNSEDIDHVNNQCLACHDAVIGPSRNAKGMMINKYYRVKKGFHDISHSKIVLVRGKITCISCHNPYKNEDKKLVVSNKGNRLCSTCHKK